MQLIRPKFLLPHLKALQAFKKVVDACFGYSLDPEYRRIIEEFKMAWQSLVNDDFFTFFYKVHVVCSHVADFVDRVGGPLGPYSEQAGEAVHLNFKSLFDRFRYLPNKTSGERLLAAVAEYNYRHIALITDDT